MRTLRRLISFSINLLFIFVVHGQRMYHIDKSRAFGVAPSSSAAISVNAAPSYDDVLGDAPTADIIAAWQEIMTVARTNTNAALLDNILIIQNPCGRMYSGPEEAGRAAIVYDQTFFSQFDGVDFIDLPYLKLFSFAHELGHIIAGDIRTREHSREQEQAADYFACSILCQLNKASAEKIGRVILTVAGANHDLNYFNKGDRIKNIETYFNMGRCSNVRSQLYEDFAQSSNIHKFWVGTEGNDYSAFIDTQSQRYTLNLTDNPGWRWTWIPFPTDFMNSFNNNSNVELSFDYSGSDPNNNDEFIGIISEPSCVDNAKCPGGSHYDLWFNKYRENGNQKLKVSYFYNDNCNCAQGTTNPQTAVVATSEVSHIRFGRNGNLYTIYVDDQKLLSFNLNVPLFNRLMYGKGTHYISNFALTVR